MEALVVENCYFADWRWQPIASAPMDGAWVLIAGGKPHDEYDDHRPVPPFVVARWEAEGKTRYYDTGGRWVFCSYDSGYYGEWCDPTHWMPLPNPPAA